MGICVIISIHTSYAQIFRNSRRNSNYYQPPQTLNNNIDNSALPNTEDNNDAADMFNALGYPTASAVLELLESEMSSQIKMRKEALDIYSKWRSYLNNQLNLMAQSDMYGGYNGLAQLSWYKELLLNPIKSPRDIESFSRSIHAGLLYGSSKGYNITLSNICQKMEIPFNNSSAEYTSNSFLKSYEYFMIELAHLASLHSQALANLSPDEVQDLNSNMFHILTQDTNVGHSVSNTKSANSMIKSLSKINQKSFYQAASIMLSFSDPAFLSDLEKLKQTDSQKQLSSMLMNKDDAIYKQVVKYIQGDLIGIISTPNGLVIIGSSANNVYDLNKLSIACAVIDIGGDDTYLEGTVSMGRPVLVLIDFNGKDQYRGEYPAIQGSAIMGFSIVIDMNGDDVYSSKHVAQGSALAGVGILIDKNGNDRYSGDRRVQGSALAGFGCLIDETGDDIYNAAMWAQGFGHPLGVGLLDDFSGNDKYYCGGKYLDSYPDTPGYEGWGQGVGAGLRDISNGGVGILLDGGGNELYEYDYIAHGGGYWQGIGILRDFSGNDNHAGATKIDFNKKNREQPRFQRLGNGFGCHYAVGFLIDDVGNDTYDSNIMNTGFGWDAAYGYCIDFSGNDRYLVTGSGAVGCGEQAGIGVLFDYKGADFYASSSLGYANPVIKKEYHSSDKCGGNISFFCDWGGNDVYNSSNGRLFNNVQSGFGTRAGFFIDKQDNSSR